MQIFKEINERQILAHKRWLCVYLLERLVLRWEDIFHHYHHKLCCSTAQKKNQNLLLMHRVLSRLAKNGF